jgi:hypothetical protein
MSNFKAISWREQVTIDEIVLNQYDYGSWIFYSASSLKQQSVIRHAGPLCSHSFMLHTPFQDN